MVTTYVISSLGSASQTIQLGWFQANARSCFKTETFEVILWLSYMHRYTNQTQKHPEKTYIYTIFKSAVEYNIIHRFVYMHFVKHIFNTYAYIYIYIDN